MDYYTLLQTTEYYRLLHTTTYYYRSLQTTTDYYRLLQSTTDYYRLLHTTTQYYRIPDEYFQILIQKLDVTSDYYISPQTCMCVIYRAQQLLLEKMQKLDTTSD